MGIEQVIGALVLGGGLSILLGHFISRFILKHEGSAPRTGEGETLTQYMQALFLFSGLSLLLCWGILSVGTEIPLARSFEIATSFITTTNWQPYSNGEIPLWVSVFGLIIPQLTGPAVGICVAMVLIRSIKGLPFGDFWKDMIRVIGYIFLLMTLICSLLIYLGQSQFHFWAGFQGILKMLGSNGGGFFIEGAQHPLDNPNKLTNTLQLALILALPYGLLIAFGKATQMVKTARVLIIVVSLYLFLSLGAGLYFEYLNNAPVDPRFGMGGVSAMTTFSTVTSCGALNSDLLQSHPLTVLLGTFNMVSTTLGGAGSGFYNLMFYVFVTIFLGSLMIGKGPGFGFRKLSPEVMSYSILGISIQPLVILAGVSYFVLVDPHTPFRDLFYNSASLGTNNGSSLGDPRLLVGSEIHSLMMLVSRFIPLWAALKISEFISLGQKLPYPILEVGGSPAGKKHMSASLRTSTGIFGGLLGTIILIFGALMYLPHLMIGPYLTWISRT